MDKLDIFKLYVKLTFILLIQGFGNFFIISSINKWSGIDNMALFPHWLILLYALGLWNLAPSGWFLILLKDKRQNKWE